MTFTFVQTNRGEEEEAKHGRLGRQRTKLKTYDVYVNGEKIGSIHQGMTTFERKSAGRRYVNSRWTSPRWFVHTPLGARYNRGHHETRRSAAEALAQLVAEMKAAAAPRPAETLPEALTWVGQWLTMLYPLGFGETMDIIRSEGPAEDRARSVIAKTAHLSHPSLDRLRELAGA